MYNKSYRGYVQTLREREVRPPLTRMAEMIAAPPTRRADGRLFVAFAGVFIIGVAIMYSIVMRSVTVKPGKALVQGQLEQSPRLSYQKNLPNFAFSSQRASHRHSPGFQRPKSPVLERLDRHGNADGFLLDMTRARVPAIPAPAVTGRPHLLPTVATHDSEGEDKENFFAAIGGAISQQFSSNAAFRQLSLDDAFLGIGYQVSRHSSLRVLGGEDVFALSRNRYYTTYHDTTFVFNGTPYANVIGEVHAVTGSTIARVYWLGGSYRYTAGNGGIRAFVEIMAGGSTDGLLTQQLLGATFAIVRRIGLDVVAQMSELLPQGNTWLTKAGVLLELSYAF